MRICTNQYRHINSINENTIIKGIATVAFIFIIASIIIINKTPPANGYEISVYNKYPWYFWFLLIFAIVCGMGILIFQSFSAKTSVWWSCGLIIVILTNLIVILMPIFRGYFTSDMSDEISHLGMIKDISITGHIGRNNVYPISHIFSVNISSICNVDSRMIIKIVPSIFYLVYIMGIYLLSKELCAKFNQSVLVITFASVLLFTYYHYLFLPTQFFLELVPLILFIFLKKYNSNRISYSMIFVIELVPMPLLHPLGTIFLIAIFLLLASFNPLYNFLKKRGAIDENCRLYNQRSVLIPSMIIGIIFFMWFCNFAMFNSTFNQAFDWFVYGYGTPAIETLSENMEAADITFLKVIELIIRTYGNSMIFSFISSIAIVYFAKKGFSSKGDLSIWECFFSSIFLIFSIFYICTLIGGFLGTGTSQRIFCWALMASTIINGLFLYEWPSKRLEKKVFTRFVLVMVIIVFTATIGISSVYPSPYKMTANFEVTTMDWSGMNWFFKNKGTYDTMHFNQLPQRAPNYLYGYSLPKPKTVGRFYMTPEHIGYDKQYTLANTIESDNYIVIGEQTIVSKKQLWPDVGKYTSIDLYKINIDPNVNKIYFNEGMNIYMAMASDKYNGD